MRLRSFSLPLVVAATLATSNALADDTQDLESVLETKVVTTVTHTAEAASAAPATTTVITAEDIRKHGIRSMNEALNYLSLGVFTTNPLHGAEIGARGILTTADYGNHVLLLIDGHAINEPYGGSASFDRGLGVPIELIDHVEVVLGPGAVLYGSNAMLGVINVVTKRAKDHSGVRFYADSELFVWGKLGASVGTTFELFGKPVELTAHVEHQQQNGPFFTFQPQDYGTDSVTGEPKRYGPGAGTGVWGGTARKSYYSKAPSAYVRIVSDRLEISLKGSSYQRATPYLDGIIQWAADFDVPNNYELERWLSADVKYRIPISAVVDIRTRLYADMYTYDWYVTSSAAEDCGDGQLGGCRRNLRALSRWVGAEVRGNFDWTKTGRVVSMLGTDARYERVTADTYIDALRRSEPSEKLDAASSNLRLGVYAQQTVNPVSWLALNGGARLDVAEGYPAAASPRAAVAVMPWRGATMKLVYSQAFRAPSMYEREWAEPYVLKAENLKPERVYATEASFEQQFGAHRFLFGAFRSIWTDLVGMASLTDEEVAAAQAAGAPIASEGLITQYRNLGRIRNYGFNAGVEGRLFSRRLRYGINVTGARSRRSEPGQAAHPVTVTPSFFGNARVSYDLGEQLPTLALAAQFANQRPADRAFDSGFAPTPIAPPTLELRAAISGAFPGVRNLSYRVTANYAFQDKGPYVIGPIQTGDWGVPATLSPVDRFRAGIGLTYVLDP